MLDELIKKMDYGISYGSGVLKALQNENLPELDLLVREAIQNSSDASIGINEKSFDVNFNTGTFVPAALNKELTSLEKLLNKIYPGNKASFIEIRDKKTCGLTGPVRLSDLKREDHGNYFKLVFDTGKEQTGSNSGEMGGSWGYGKSVYYRVGIGLVIFYSQIKVEDKFEERLIISLTEHENGHRSLLKEVCDESVGRAWWGKKISKFGEEILPVTDSVEIQRILDIFGLERFKQKKGKGQTGTSIIIPYIDENKLLNGIFPEDCGISSEDIDLCVWRSSVEGYLKLAVQKWYAPKIFNKKLMDFSNQKWLAVKINRNSIKNTDNYEMFPFFQLVQELYNTALAFNARKKYSSEKYSSIECAAVPSQRVEGNTAGHVAFIRFTQKELFGNDAALNPYIYLRLFNRGTLNDAIVMFTRTPGMVLDYKIDGPWVKQMPKSEKEDEYLVAFFVPDCSLMLKNDTKNLHEYAGSSFGEYLRKCEKSDHMDWEDKSGLTLIANMKNQVVNKVKDRIKEDDEKTTEGTASKLAGKLGHSLLPKVGYGKKNDSSGGKGGTRKLDNLIIDFKPVIKSECIEIDFEMTFKNARKEVVLELFMEHENGNVNARSWEEDMDKPFPISFDSISAIRTCSGSTEKILEIHEDCLPDNPVVESDFTQVALVFSSRNRASGVKIKNEILNAKIYGKMIVKTEDRKYVCNIKEAKEDKELKDQKES